MASLIQFIEAAPADIPTPAAGRIAFFLDSSTGAPSYKDSSGTVVAVTLSDPELVALAGLTSAANKIPMFSGSGTATLLDLDTDGTLAANSDTKLASQKAVRTAINTAVAGLSWKQAVRAATTTAHTLSTDFANSSVIDGVTLATGDRILIKNQASGSENGIYIVAASGSPTRATDADAGAELVNASVYVSEGTVNADTQWTCTTNATITVNSTSLSFAQLTSGTGTTLDGLSDVVITSAADLDVLGYNAGGGDWVNIASTGTGDNVRAASPALTGSPTAPTQSAGDNSTKIGTTAYADNAVAKQPEVFMIALSDETTALTTGTAKVTFRMPFACSMTALPRANVNTVSSSGTPTFDIKKNGTTIFSTTLTIDVSEKTSVTAATPAVLTSSPTTFADDDEITIDISTAGTGTKGAKITLNVVRT